MMKKAVSVQLTSTTKRSHGLTATLGTVQGAEESTWPSTWKTSRNPGWCMMTYPNATAAAHVIGVWVVPEEDLSKDFSCQAGLWAGGRNRAKP